MGRVIHFEIHAENPQRAIDFYTKVFNPQLQKWEGPFEYWSVITGEDNEPGITGGLIKRKGIIDGTAVIAYVCTVNVDDLSKTEKIINENGGIIVVPKMPVPGAGWLLYAKDTEGNIFGCMQNDPEVK